VGQLNKKFKSDKINIKIYNAATDGKSLRGIIYDFIHWFPKINNFKPKYTIFYLGINERTLADQIEEKMFDLNIQEKKIDRIKDYIKNNSFVYGKYKTIANKYFPKETSGYFLNNEKLYNNFTYTNYKQAKNLKREIFDEDNKMVEQLEKRLLILEDIMKSNNLIPVFITQVAYDGLNNQKLFLINESLKKFSRNKNYHLIKLDEIIEMKLHDFYDNVHTTPKGSKKIANTIYPLLKKIFTN
jgi:lysophospholipase L1-like esterase